MNMKTWANAQIAQKNKKAMPVLSFPSVQLLGITVKQLISDPDLQARGMKLIADNFDTAASVSMMDLSVEAEAFGAKVKFSDDEVPTVTGRLVQSAQDAENLKIPKVGTGRTGLYIEAIKKAAKLITDRPVFAGVIGPFSLAGRLLDMTEIMMLCYEEPETVHKVLEKTTEFITEYILSYKSVGANGVIMAEPAAGLLSPSLIKEFSSDYIQKIVKKVKSDDFAFIYHNCGNTVPLVKEILAVDATGYHFGNAINMKDILPLMPKTVPVFGNIDPAGEFKNGTPASIREKTLALLKECGPKYNNFIISSGCDIPPMSSTDNIKSFFKAVAEYYK